VDIAAYLLWRDLSSEALRHCLAAVITGDVVVASQAAAAAFLAAQRRASLAFPAAVPLTAREQVVLRRLAEGLTHKEIAVAEGLSRRTVELTAARLAARLEASPPFVLGMQAARLGLLDR
jgi:DNA-binding NarL/FixJ family response regulator